MKIVVIGNDDLKQELLQQGLQPAVQVEWLSDISKCSEIDQADVFIDLLFDEDREDHLEVLKKLPAEIIIVNDVAGTTENLPDSFVRINAWPTFLKRQIVEASCKNETIKKSCEIIFNCFNKKIEWIKDTPGFITARIVSMIINEAYYALNDAISTREEIDIAMKAGTHYPYGPFEWCKLIGPAKINSLLNKLSKTNSKYNPSTLISIDTN